MNPKLIILFIALLLAVSYPSLAARSEPAWSSQEEAKASVQSNAGGIPDGNPGQFYGPGSGFDIPGMGSGWGNGIVGGGYGAGSGGPNGGHSRNGVVRPSVVCQEKGPCYKKRLICPAKCFTSYSHSGKNYGSGGGGGGCTMDCTKKCVAYC